MKEQKVLTVEKMRDYLSACEWGDVPDKAHALVAYLVMDGYVLPPTGKMNNRAEAQVSSYARLYGGNPMGLPKVPGFYWAFWLTATPGTVEADELTPALKWDVVEVDYNMMGGDPTHPEYWLVAVPGVERAQFVNNFMWGPRIPNYEAKREHFFLTEGPILDRILGKLK